MQKGVGYYLETRAVTEQLIREHLNGKLCLGTYPIADGKCILCAFDVDIRKGFPYDNQNFELCWKQTLSLRAKLLEFGIKEDQMGIEFSGRRGYHIWIFFEEPQEAAQVYRFVTAIRDSVNIENPEKINIEASQRISGLASRAMVVQ